MNCKNFINGFMSVRILHSFFPKNVKNKFSDIIGLYYCTDSNPLLYSQAPFCKFLLFCSQDWISLYPNLSLKIVQNTLIQKKNEIFSSVSGLNNWYGKYDWVESNLVCNHSSDSWTWKTIKQESDLFITSIITDRIGQHKVLLTINQNYDKIWREIQ